MNNCYYTRLWNGKRVSGQSFNETLEAPKIIWSYGSAGPFIFDTDNSYPQKLKLAEFQWNMIIALWIQQFLQIHFNTPYCVSTDAL